MNIRQRFVTVFVCCFAVPCGFAAEAAGPESEKPRAASAASLDEQLLQGLEDDSGDMPDGSGARQADANEAGDGAGPADSLDRQLLEDMKDQETDQPQDPLGQIGAKMRRAGRLIVGREAGDSTQELQREIVSDIDKLLDDARRRLQRATGSSSRRQLAQRAAAAQPQPQPANAAAQGQDAKRPAADSDARLNNGGAARPDFAPTRDLVQEVWGHLPQRDRQQVINSAIESFIPKYEPLIREYFKRLSEATRGE
jgi:hypothetical protein